MLAIGAVDEVLEYDKGSKSSSGWNAIVSNLKKRRFDLLICPHESSRSQFLVAHLKAKTKIGFKSALSFLIYDHAVKRPLHLPEALRQISLLEPLEKLWGTRLAEYAKTQTAPGGQRDDTLTPVPAWASMEDATFSEIRSGAQKPSQRVREVLRSRGFEFDRPLAILAPGSVWETKKWTEEGFAEVANDLLAQGFAVGLTGSKDESAICERICAKANGAFVLAGQTSLFESTEVLALAKVFIGNDSGAMHMASVAGTPTVTVFGPTVLEFGYRPWQNRTLVAQTPKGMLNCRPCGKHGARTCPIGTHDCMKLVRGSDVSRSVRKLLSP